MTTPLTTDERDYLAELEKANEPARALLMEAGRHINYLRTVVRHMLPYFPKEHPYHVGYSEAAAPSFENVAFAFVRELQRRFGEYATLHDIEIAQEQGWGGDISFVCEAYEAAHSPEKARV